MQGNRNYSEYRKSTLILDNKFPIRKDMVVGEEGQLIISGQIVAEREVELSELTVVLKKVKVSKVEKIDLKSLRML